MLINSMSASSGVWSRSRSFSFEADSDSVPICLVWTLCNVDAVYSTFVQFILQLKLCLYIIVHHVGILDILRF